MELMGASSSREWNSLVGIFSSDHQESNHDHQLMNGHDFLANSTVPSYHEHQSAVGASSLEFPFSICTFEGDVPYSYGAYSDDRQPVACVTSNISLALSEQELAMRSNADLYLNIGGDNDDHDHDHHRCMNQGMIINADHGDDHRAGNNSKKRSRSSPASSIDHDQGTKSERNVKPRKNQKHVLRDKEEDGGAGIKGSISPNSSSSAEETSNPLAEEVGGLASSSSPKGSAMALNLNGKARASRGSATDPQSVYARKRREKINERLRILQNLVPNGTKVDISTMLEEAVQYVKFLQLQIKLLSSDDLWMYAPLAYNGMSIGIDLRLAASRQH